MQKEQQTRVLREWCERSANTATHFAACRVPPITVIVWEYIACALAALPCFSILSIAALEVASTHARTRACMFDKILIMHALLHPVLAEARFFVLHAYARTLTCQCARAHDFRVAHSASAARVEPKMPSALARSHTKSHYVSVAARCIVLHSGFQSTIFTHSHGSPALGMIIGMRAYLYVNTLRKNRTKCSV